MNSTPFSQDTRTSTNQDNSSRIIPIIILLLLIATVLYIPARIGSLGYLPQDDALRHVAKVVSGKEWDQVIVVRDNIKFDSHPGWHALLGVLHHKLGLGKHALLVFSVSFLFLLIAIIPLFFLKRPEAWLASILIISLFLPFLIARIFIGRPYLCTVLMLIIYCFIWKKLKVEKTPWYLIFTLTIVNSVIVSMHPSIYLYVFIILGFLFAREWRVSIRLIMILTVSSIIGYLITGHPILLFKRVFYEMFHATDQSILSRMLVSEFQPIVGFGVVFSIPVAILLFLRVIRKKWSVKSVDNPVFYLAVTGFVLGHIVGRFWHDWGLIALMVWIAQELDEILTDIMPRTSLKRLGSVIAFSISFFIIITSDGQNRWSRDNPRFPLSYANSKPEELEWFPDSGGIIYSDQMRIFYSTFFENPHAPWRYILCFEPELMPSEDLKIYRNIQRMSSTFDSYIPWVQKMNNKDRLILLNTFKPKISELEWRCLNRNIWVGRLPVKSQESDSTDNTIGDTIKENDD